LLRERNSLKMTRETTLLSINDARVGALERNASRKSCAVLTRTRHSQVDEVARCFFLSRRANRYVTFTSSTMLPKDDARSAMPA